MQRALESPPTQLTVNQTAGVAVNAAAVQPATASHARYLVSSLPAAFQPQTVSTIELGGQVGLPQAEHHPRLERHLSAMQEPAKLKVQRRMTAELMHW
jgi:hypothetical protein